MNLVFHTPVPEQAHELAPYFSMRPDRACDSGYLDTYIWKDHYNIQICEVDQKALLFVMHGGKEYFSCLPYCSEEDLPYYFQMLQQYFNEQLKRPLKIYLADEEGVRFLHLTENSDYYVKEETDLKDYLYDGDGMRTLGGKKYQKKRNLVNKFNREYDGRWQYVRYKRTDHQKVMQFLDEWYERRMAEEPDGLDELKCERSGIRDILSGFQEMAYHCGGIEIDGQLKAISIGTYNPREEMSVISVEKADAEIPGIYQVINQQFLINEFPHAKIINREDDMGLPGLRKAKESYNPIDFARKYLVVQKNFKGYQDAMYDFYENEIEHYDSNSDQQEKMTADGNTAGFKESTTADGNIAGRQNDLENRSENEAS